MRVLSVTSECVPLIKTGGLADVAGALPAALKPHGVEMRTILPGYPKVMKAMTGGSVVMEFENLFNGPARVIFGEAGGLDLYVLEAPHLYDRAGGPYLDQGGRDYPDNAERFAALSWAAARIAADGAEGWKPDILHCHDWQAGFAPSYLEQLKVTGVGTVMTVHNIAFQGFAPAHKLDWLRLPHHRFNKDGFEYWGNISALKAGLMAADKVTTVSPTYADELLTPEFGLGLEGVMQARRGDLTGILNGIDEEVWNPATDKAITPYTDLKGKEANKAALRREFGLPEADGPLCVVVSRLTSQKGFDLLLEALPALLAGGGQLALLGSGAGDLEHAFSNAARDPNVSVYIGYNEEMSHRLIAGGDAILVPSRFEPCGLTQLYGLKYGTIPLVTMTGGLADTVINANPMAVEAGVATGVQVFPVAAEPLKAGLSRLCALYRDRKVWTKMVKTAMKSSVGWDRSAGAYAALYKDIAASK